jgi:hypothetical protein
VIYFGARLGFTSAQALASATSLAAQSCAAGDRKGKIAPGYDADLLAVAGDLATDLTAVLQPMAIYRAGHRCELIGEAQRASGTQSARVRPAADNRRRPAAPRHRR